MKYEDHYRGEEVEVGGSASINTYFLIHSENYGATGHVAWSKTLLHGFFVKGLGFLRSRTAGLLLTMAKSRRRTPYLS
jgi:hypothetical protein